MKYIAHEKRYADSFLQIIQVFKATLGVIVSAFIAADGTNITGRKSLRLRLSPNRLAFAL